MNNFIKVHFAGDNGVVRMNKTQITSYYWLRDLKITDIYLSDGQSYHVRETPCEIDAMIDGIIYDKENDPYRKVIEE